MFLLALPIGANASGDFFVVGFFSMKVDRVQQCILLYLLFDSGSTKNNLLAINLNAQVSICQLKL